MNMRQTTEITTQNQYLRPTPPETVDQAAPSVFIEGIDCLELAKKIVQKTSIQPCVLNMANQHYVGGDYLSGFGQEESIIRRTNLLDSLKKLDGVVHGNIANPYRYQLKECLGFRNDQQKAGFGEFTCLYSPNITVRQLSEDPEEKEQNFNASDAFCVNIMSSAAYNLAYDDEKLDRPFYYAGTIFKILNQLRTAKQHNQRVLILGAFGCGAFHNDASIIAEIYRSAIHEYEFGGCFDKIYFAIKPSRQSDNYKHFNDAFSSPSPIKPIADWLTLEVPQNVEKSNDQLHLMMRPYKQISSKQEFIFLINREINNELHVLENAAPKQQAKISFVTQLSAKIKENPDAARDIIAQSQESAAYHALTPKRGIFKGKKYPLIEKLLKLTEQFNSAQELITLKASL